MEGFEGSTKLILYIATISTCVVSLYIFDIPTTAKLRPPVIPFMPLLLKGWLCIPYQICI